MVTAAIVQARLGSTRLPAKVLLPLPTGRTVLEEVLYRCKQIPGVDVVALATPKGPSARMLHHLMVRHADICIGYDGAEDDVLGRYACAATIVGADVIMRITADCPLIDPEVCGKVLAAYNEAHSRSDADYCSNCHPRTWPVGFDCEVFSADALGHANKLATLPDDREHVTQFLRRFHGFMQKNIVSEGEDRSHLRWTLDTLEDYVRIWSVFQEQMREAA